MVLSGDRFDNPEMPEWLENALLLSFIQKNLDNIKGYQKLWEDIRNEC
jgi:hypothetical protein